MRGITQGRRFCHQFRKRCFEPLLSTGRRHNRSSPPAGVALPTGGACRHPLAAAWCSIDARNAMQGRTQQMVIGFNAPTAGPLSAADNLKKIVVGMDAMVFEYATF